MIISNGLCADVIPKSAKRTNLLQYNNCNRTRLIIARESASLNAGPVTGTGSDGPCLGPRGCPFRVNESIIGPEVFVKVEDRNDGKTSRA